MKKIKIGTRGSNLAIMQSKILAKEINRLYPEYDIELKIIKTLGDIRKDSRLDSLDRKGVFTKEIEDGLINKEIDIAVHSMKDMPSDINPIFHFPISLKREDSSDILIMREGLCIKDFYNNKMRIGTGSKRRILQLDILFKNIIPIHIRGNIQTRINKINELNLDAVVLANAGIRRLDLKNLNSYILPRDKFLPAPCQGLLAIQVLRNNDKINNLLKPLNDPDSFLQMEIERAFIKELGAGCHSPMGFYINYIDKDNFEFTGLFGSRDLKKYIKKNIKAHKENAINKAIELASSLKMEIEDYDSR